MKLKIDLEQIETITYKLDDTTKITVSIENGELNIETIKVPTKEEIERSLAMDRFKMLCERSGETRRKYFDAPTEHINDMNRAYGNTIKAAIKDESEEKIATTTLNTTNLSIPTGTTIKNFKEVCEKADEIVKRQREDVKKNYGYGKEVVKTNLQEMFNK